MWSYLPLPLWVLYSYKVEFLIQVIFIKRTKKTAAATNNTHATTFSQHWWSLYSVLHRQHSLGFHWIFNMHMHTPAVHRTSLLCLIHRTRHCTQHTQTPYMGYNVIVCTVHDLSCLTQKTDPSHRDSREGTQCYCLYSTGSQFSVLSDGLDAGSITWRLQRWGIHCMYITGPVWSISPEGLDAGSIMWRLQRWGKRCL